MATIVQRALQRVAARLRRSAPTGSMAPQATGNLGGWVPVVREPYAGAWQRGDPLVVQNPLAQHTVYACITLIASDVGKMCHAVKRYDKKARIWVPTESDYDALLYRPNRYQNHIQFKETWMMSKLRAGNTYVLKQRNARGVVEALYVLDPGRVLPLVAPDGTIFYELRSDNLTGLQEASVTVPASEIIHDRMNCLFHPLVGMGPLYAAMVNAGVSLQIERNVACFHQNGGSPKGILVAPGPISKESAEILATQWDTNFGGDNTGKTAAIGDGMKYESVTMTAVDSQLVEQQKLTAEFICSAFHVPPFKVGAGALPPNSTVEMLNLIYYTDCLQSHVEQYETSMDEGLGYNVPVAGERYSLELDEDALLRMDQPTKLRMLAEGVKGSVYAPNEARQRLDLAPLDGGDTVYMQQQNYSLAALNKRDSGEDPFGKAAQGNGDTTPDAAPPTPAADAEAQQNALEMWQTKFTNAFAQEFTHDAA